MAATKKAKATKKRKPPAPSYNPERAACILAEAEMLGDQRAAKRWGCTARTVENYRARLAKEPGLVALFERKRALLEPQWIEAAGRALRRCIARIEELIEDPDASLRDVVGAAKILGELDITKGALTGGEHTEPDRSGEHPPPHPGAEAPAGSGARAVH